MTNHEHDGEDELQAARRTAHALGQSEGAEQAEVAAELAASPQARLEVEAVEALAARLKEAAREAPQPEPSPALREAIERRLAELEPAAGPRGYPAAAQGPARPWWRSRLTVLALAAACLVALAVPIVQSTNLLGPGKERDVAMRPAAEPSAKAPMVECPIRRRALTKDQRALPEKFDKTDFGELEAPPTADLVVDPTLEKPKPAKAVPETEYGDKSKVFEHRGGASAATSMPPASSAGGALAFGPGPTVNGAPGLGTGGQDSSGPDGSGPAAPGGQSGEQGQSGRSRLGVGAKDDAGIVGHVTLDESNSSKGTTVSGAVIVNRVRGEGQNLGGQAAPGGPAYEQGRTGAPR